MGESSSLTQWMMLNVVYEIPVVGDFCKEDFKTAMYKGGKCIAMLTGGTTAMLAFGQAEHDESTQTHAAKMVSSMVIGGTMGKVAFNIGYETIHGILHGLALFRQRMVAVNDPLESNPITCNVHEHAALRNP